MSDEIKNDDVSFESEEEIVGEESLKEKISKLREKLKETETEKQNYLTGWQKAQADFVNLRRRDEEAKKDFAKFATEELIVAMLAVADSFSMAFGNKEAWEKVDKNWRMGVEYIYNQFLGILKERGLQEFEPKTGDAFDPANHLAVETITTSDEKADHTVAEVIQKGYSLSNKIIRAAKVKVFSFKENEDQK